MNFREQQSIQAIPPGAPAMREGWSLVQDVIIYDTPLQIVGAANPAVAAGQLRNGEALYNVSGRCGNDELCNLTQVGQLNDRQEFLIEGIAIEVYFSNPDLYQLLRYCRVELQVQRAIKFQGWAVDCAAGGGIAGYRSVSTDANVGPTTVERSVLNNGDPRNGNYYQFTKPIELAPIESFKLYLYWTEDITGLAVSPITQINEDEGEKLIRARLHGIVGKDILSN